MASVRLFAVAWFLLVVPPWSATAAVPPPLPDAEPLATPVPRPEGRSNPLRSAEKPQGDSPAGAENGGDTKAGTETVGGEKGGAEKDSGKSEEKQPDPARDGRCDRCGSCRLVGYVCVPRKTEKKIKKVCWDVKCEPYCVPGRSIFCGRKCGKDDCGCWSYPLWRPTCAEVVERRIPEKREVTRVVPSWEWKAEERCAACACGLRSGREGGHAGNASAEPSCATAPVGSGR